MKRKRTGDPLLHVFLCDAKAYEETELLGGWITLPAPERRVLKFLQSFPSGTCLITDYDLTGSCFEEGMVQKTIYRNQKNPIGLNRFLCQERSQARNRRKGEQDGRKKERREQTTKGAARRTSGE